MTTFAAGLSKISLLYVEDDPCTRETVSKVIAEQLPGVTIHPAENGEEGLRLYKEHNPDLVLTDLSMPVMDGMRMAHHIKALNPAANIVAVTAKDETHYLLDAIKIGINRYLLKPLEFPMLFEAIEDCLARIALERQNRMQQAVIRQLSRAVEQGASMVMITNARGVIEYVNPRFTQVTGYHPEEVMGQNLLVILGNITSNHHLEILWSTVNRGATWRGEFVGRKKNGDLYVNEMSVSPLTDEEDGRVTHFVAVMEDISERKQTQENMRRMNQELEQRVMERTADLEASSRELEVFCYSIAHDLSTPLRGMSCFSSILLEDYADKLDGEGREYLERIQSASVRMGELIRDLLKLSRVTRGELVRKRIDLSALAGEILGRLAEAEPGRRVETLVAGGVEADGDPGLVGLMLESLLENAWKYTGKSGSPRIEFGSCRANGETAYYVRDNGVGFDMSYAEKIFLPFERLHGVTDFAGTGIGLATVQRIVTRHTGRVWAEGEEGKGATFYFTLGARQLSSEGRSGKGFRREELSPSPTAAS